MSFFGFLHAWYLGGPLQAAFPCAIQHMFTVGNLTHSWQYMLAPLRVNAKFTYWWVNTCFRLKEKYGISVA